jgi:hypothetical protein
MRGKELLTTEQRTSYMSIPDDMLERELEKHYTFTIADELLLPRNKRLREFYDKKREEGKPFKVAVIV